MTELTVFGYAGAATADSCCDTGTGCCAPSPVDVAQAIAQLVAEKYPGEYRVKYVDTFSIDAFDYSDVLQAIQEQSLSLPVLAVAGTPRLSGEFSTDDIERVLQEVRTA
jgi:hypothetical protein